MSAWKSGMTLVKLPKSLLLDKRLPASARVLWAILWLEYLLNGTGRPLSQRYLAERLGQSVKTVQRGLALLLSLGWLVRTDTPLGFRPVSLEPITWASPSLPTDLLLDPHISAQAKVTFAALQSTPGFRYPEGKCSYPELHAQTGASRPILRTVLRNLEAKDWIETLQTNSHSPIEFRLRNPAVEERKAKLRAAKRRLRDAESLAQGLMCEYLTAMVETPFFLDNARPGFLINPATGERMEYDRYYDRARVAFEFNGPQHYESTERFPDGKKVRKQGERDALKRAISEKMGIKLVIVHAVDLTLEGMLHKVEETGGRLVVRSLEGEEFFLNYLATLSRNYLRKVV